MAKSEEEIRKEIEAHIRACGGNFSDWYVGISNDASQRLFDDDQHKVREKDDAWIYSTASSSAAARSIERYFLDHLGTSGGEGGGDETARMVYAYKKSPHTKP